MSPTNNADAKAFLGIPAFVTVPVFIRNIDQLYFYHIHGYAGFTEWTYKLTGQLSLTAGVRYNRDTPEAVSYTHLSRYCCKPRCLGWRRTSFIDSGSN